MRNAHLSTSWGLWIVVLLGFGVTSSIARGAEQDGIQVTLSKVRFSEVIHILADQSGVPLILDTDVDPMIDLVDFPTPTPLEKIVSSITESVGLDSWKVGDTYHIGKRPVVEATAAKPGIITAPQPRDDGNTPSKVSAPGSPSGVVRMQNDAQTENITRYPANFGELNQPAKKTRVAIRNLELKHTSVNEVEYMFGLPSANIRDKNRERVIDKRIENWLEPRNANIQMPNPGDDSPQGYNSWLGNAGRSSRGPAGNNQLPGGGFPGGGYPGGGFPGGTGTINPPGGYPGPGAITPPGGINPGGITPPTTPNNPRGAAGQRGGLARFLPEGVEFDIVGLNGLNSLLVKATAQSKEEAEQAINDLETLIKFLDKPVKQVIVEAMFVKMDVKDAMSLGASWEYAGMPISITNINGGGSGFFTLKYQNGNVRASLAASITNNQAKVVNAPRVVVQNGGSASIMLEDTVPFVIVNESEDVFGRTIQIPEIDFQPFQQGLTVNQVTIHPDDSVTLEIDPILEAPSSDGVGIPGGSGQVSGRSSTSISTIVRVKNGETIMMGGFVSKNEVMGGTRTPLLSDIPIVGPLLFKSKTHNSNNSEVMIFVTPTIMKDDTTDFGGMTSLTPLF